MTASRKQPIFELGQRPQGEFLEEMPRRQTGSLYQNALLNLARRESTLSLRFKDCSNSRAGIRKAVEKLGIKVRYLLREGWIYVAIHGDDTTAEPTPAATPPPARERRNKARIQASADAAVPRGSVQELVSAELAKEGLTSGDLGQAIRSKHRDVAIQQIYQALSDMRKAGIVVSRPCEVQGIQKNFLVAKASA